MLHVFIACTFLVGPLHARPGRVFCRCATPQLVLRCGQHKPAVSIPAVTLPRNVKTYQHLSTKGPVACSSCILLCKWLSCHHSVVLGCSASPSACHLTLGLRTSCTVGWSEKDRGGVGPAVQGLRPKLGFGSKCF